MVFDGHVEVVIRAAGASLSTIGADSLPGLTVNAHKFPAPFGPEGVLGFVDNGDLVRTASREQVPAVTERLALYQKRTPYLESARPEKR